MKKLLFISAATSLSLLTVACSTADSGSMDTGDRISARGGDIGDYGKDWSDGQKDVAQGRKSIEKSAGNLADGERDLARAREQVAKAERQIAAAVAARADAERQVVVDGNDQMQRAEAAYTAIRTGPSAVN